MSEHSCGGRDWSKELPDDVTVEILCRLPEKPLIQSKRVSKNWNFLISNVCVPRISSSAPLSGCLFRWTPLYGSGYLMDYAPSCGGGRGGGGKFVESYSALLPFQHTGDDVLDCCNGMLLIFNRFSVPLEYYVCNPATKQCIAIPVCPTHSRNRFAALGFNPLEPSNYKIVRLAHSASTASASHPPELDVFSSVTGNWVNHPVPLELELYGFKWLDCCFHLNRLFYVLSAAKYLLCFNLKTDKLNAQAIKLPKVDEYPGYGLFRVSNGCVYYTNDDDFTIPVWLLEAGDWILKHSINVQDLAKSPAARSLTRSHLIPGFVPYALHPTSEIIFLGTFSTIFSYDLKTNQFKLFCKLERDRLIVDGKYYIFPYSRCLVSLKDFTRRKVGADPNCKYSNSIVPSLCSSLR